MKIINGGVTAPKGFQAIGIAAGIKKGKKDMAMLYSEAPCAAAGTFTTNVVKAAPVKWDQNIVYHQETAQAVVMNSGIANACTGTEGYGYCEETAKAAAKLLNLDPLQVLTASTGVIGKQLPMDVIKTGIETMVPMLSHSEAAGTLAAEAIMTTDTKKKEIAVQFELGGKTVTIGGMSKGSGMIHPNMCTMLAFITTDAAISKELLQKALSGSVQDSYNMISVDGDTSTNDTCLLMANGLAGNQKIKEEDQGYQTFKEALDYVNIWLYDPTDETVLLADSGNPEHNRQRIPLRYVYDAMKTSSRYQYLLVTSVDPDGNTWKHDGIDIRWKKPRYYSGD